MHINNNIILDIKKGNSLLRYAYMGSGAKYYNDIIADEGYHLFRNEIKIVQKYLSYIKRSLKGTVIVMGVGNGEKLKQLLDDVNEIYLIDLNKEYLNLSAEYLGDRVKIIHSSFEKVDLKIFGTEVSFLMLGGTLGNLNDYVGFLNTIKSKCPNSNMLVGMEFDEESNIMNKKELLQKYSDSNMMKFIFHPLKSLGFNSDDGNFQFFFNKNDERVEANFLFNEKSRSKRKKMGIEEIDKTCLGWSHKPKRIDFYQNIIKNGLKLGPFICDFGQNTIVEIYW